MTIVKARAGKRAADRDKEPPPPPTDAQSPPRRAERDAAPPSATSEPRKPRSWRTGRNVQLNIKATAETISRFYALADQSQIPLGELLKRALDAYEAGLTDEERKRAIT